MNMLIWTRWTHNGLEVDLTGVANDLTLSLENTENSTAGLYQLEVTHFFLSQVDGTIPSPVVEPDDMYCSGVILDALQYYALFSPVKFHVTLPGNWLVEVAVILPKDSYISVQGCTCILNLATHRHTIHTGSTEGSRQKIYYQEFFKNQPLTIQLQIPLLQIQGVDFRLLSEINQLKYVLFYDGKILLDTSQTPFYDYFDNSRFDVNYQITNRNTAQVELTFASPQRSAAGTYEFQFYMHADAIQHHLNESMCSDVYLNFIPGKVRIFRILIGTATININMAGKHTCKFVSIQ